MTNEYRIEKYLKERVRGTWITVQAITIVLKIGNSSCSRILRELEAKGYVVSEKITTKGRGQPTLAFRWNHERFVPQ